MEIERESDSRFSVAYLKQLKEYIQLSSRLDAHKTIYQTQV